MSDAQQNEVLAMLECNRDKGINFTQLYGACKTIGGEEELSRCIFALTKARKCFKRNNNYYPAATSSTDEAIKAIVQGIPDLQQPPEVAKEVKVLRVKTPRVKETKPNVVEEKVTKVIATPRGTLNRTKVSGAIALTIYKLRKEAPLTAKEIREITQLDHLQTRQALEKLIAQDYIKIVDHPEEAGLKSSLTTYTWGDSFSYPFDNMLGTDDHLIPTSLVLWKSARDFAKGDGSKPITVGSDGVISTPMVATTNARNNSAVIELLGRHIAFYEKELEELKALKAQLEEEDGQARQSTSPGVQLAW